MRFHKALAAGLFLFAGLLIAPASDAAAGDLAVRTMMEVSGMVEQYADLGEQWRAEMLQIGATRADIPKDVTAELAEICGRVMEGQRFLDELEAALADSLAPDEIAAMTAFYQTDLGQRIRAAEVAAVKREGAAPSDSAAQIEELKRDPARNELFRRMDAALFASDISASMALSLMHAVASGLLEGQDRPPTPEAREALEARLNAMHESISDQVRDQVIATFVDTYRDVPIDDLRVYTEFLESEEARANYAAFQAAVDELLAERGAEIGRELAAFMKQKRA